MPDYTPAAHALLMALATFHDHQSLANSASLERAAGALLAEQAKREAPEREPCFGPTITRKAPETPAVTVSDEVVRAFMAAFRVGADVRAGLNAAAPIIAADLAAENARLKSKYENPSDPYPW